METRDKIYFDLTSIDCSIRIQVLKITEERTIVFLTGKDISKIGTIQKINEVLKQAPHKKIEAMRNSHEYFMTVLKN